MPSRNDKNMLPDFIAKLQSMSKPLGEFILNALANTIGTVIGGFDGRRGLIYHLAVLAEYRKQGVASGLIEEVEKRLHAKGCVKCYLLSYADNTEAINFYKNRGWHHQDDNIIFGKEFP